MGLTEGAGVGVFMTPEYLEGFADKVSEMVVAKMKGRLPEKQNLIGTKEAAAYLGITEDYLRRLARDNQIRFHRRPGKSRYGFLEDDLNEYIQSL